MLAPMSEELLRDLLAALEQHEVRYAIFGGIALGAHGLPRATKDLDLFLDPAPGNGAAARAARVQVLSDPALEEITATDLEEYGLVRYGLANHDFMIDPTGRIGEALRFDELEIERSTLMGVPVSVVSVRQLMRMKLAAGPPQDLADLVRLREHFGREEE